MRRLAISLTLTALFSGALVTAVVALDATPAPAATEAPQPSGLLPCQALPVPGLTPSPSPAPGQGPAPAPQPAPSPSPGGLLDPGGLLGQLLGPLCGDQPLPIPGLDPGLPPLPVPLPDLPTPGK
jgi:hypothetical protein